MNKKPRWRDREGNLYTDSEVVHTRGNKVVVRKGFPDTEVEVLPLAKKFPK